MATLLFYDDSHTYEVDGYEVPSVSELTRFLTREVYENTPQRAMESAGTRGTAVHKATEAMDMLGRVEVDDDIAGYVKAYVKFRKEHNPTWTKVEWRVHNGIQYAGTLDRYGEMNKMAVILDIKTTANLSGMHKVLYTAQLNLYRLAVMKETPVEELWILQLKKDGTYKLIKLEVNEPLAQACITMHEAINKTKRKRRKKA